MLVETIKLLPILCHQEIPMNRSSHGSSTLLRLLSLSAFFLCLITIAGEPAKPAKSNQPQEPTQVSASAEAALPEASAGMKGYIDPKTRQIVTPTPAVQATEPVSVDSPMSTSHEGLKEERSEARPGGYLMNLKGRFNSAMVVTVDADGNTVVGCDNAETHEEN